MTTVDETIHRNDPWGWIATKVDNRWCVGLWGNLDCIHDAAIVVDGGMLSEKDRENLANFIAEKLNERSNVNEAKRQAYLNDELDEFPGEWHVEPTKIEGQPTVEALSIERDRRIEWEERDRRFEEDRQRQFECESIPAPSHR